MGNELIYLASPYSHSCEWRRHSRFVAVAKVAGQLISDGKVLFCPITHSHSITRYSPLEAMNHEMWMNIDLTMLERCDKLYVVTLDGWKESEGVRQEIEFATNKGIPITYLNEQGELINVGN